MQPNRQLGVSRWRASASGKKNPQFVEELFPCLPFVIRREPFQSSGDQSFRPTAIEDLILRVCGSVILEKGFRLFDLLFMQRQKTLSATALQRPFPIRSVCKEIFQGGKQKRAEPAFPLIDAFVDLVLEEVSEKALRQILRIVHRVSAAAHKTVKRRPIGLAKLRERGLRKLRFGLASPRRQNNAPVSRRKQIALTTPVPCQRLHVSGFYQDRRRKASRKKITTSCSTRSGIPLYRERDSKGHRNDFSKRVMKQGQNNRRKSH